MLPFALTIFTGAFLLFQVQPLIGKYILPWFGGGPGVWTTCLLFFQVVLLGGYAYAHATSRWLAPRRQAVLHLVLLLVAVALLPITPSDSWKAHLAGNPTFHILLLLGGTIGLPYFVLSSTGPLMQQWFSATNPGVSPYRLYALSNFGSLLALLSYPVFFEVKFSRHAQAVMWSSGLVVFVACAAYCAWRVWRLGTTGAPAAGRATDPAATGVSTGADTLAAEAPVTATDRLLWLLLPAIASILLVATTNKLSQEVAVIPFLWVLPLSLYLLTFIICFDHARWYQRGVFVALLVMGIAAACVLLPEANSVSMRVQIVVYSVILFVACMVCHGELYQLKPPPRHLTGFYLAISAGGAIGGLFVAVIAPALFDDYRELQIGLWLLSYVVGVVCFHRQSRSLALGAAVGALATAFVIPWMRSYIDDSEGLSAELLAFFRERALWVCVGVLVIVACTFQFRRLSVAREWRPRMAVLLMIFSVALGAVFVVQWPHKGDVLLASRNFYGTLKVFDYYPDDPVDHYKLLLHGATTHGLQFVKPSRSIIPTTYYAETSGVGRAIDHLPDGPRRLGLVGLGTATLAAYGRPGDTLRIYEINPAVQRIARTEFTYLDVCRSKIDIVMGDARLSMEREVADNQSQQFDLLALDAFSSDAIPVHLLTKEAFAIYLRELKPGGILAVHTSNRYLNLRPVVEKLAAYYGLSVAAISDDHEEEWWTYATTWILVTKDKQFLEQESIKGAADEPETLKRPAPFWTDDHTSLYEILK
jgi:hypothetical protein